MSGIQTLNLNTATQSSTHNNTVERACVDEKLTGQCIQYHNDQWFSYTPTTAEPFFVNVTHRRCREGNGVQLVIFNGEMCQTESYDIVACLSPGTAEDYYFKVEQPKQDVSYIMVIDGYLGDFCDFEIQIARRAQGLPAERLPPIAEARAVAKELMVDVTWEYQPGQEEGRYFQVMRRTADEVKKWKIQLAQNSRGELGSDYELTDTLTRPGKATYEVYLVDVNNEHHLYASEQVVVSDSPSVRQSTSAFFPFSVKRKTNLQVTITDAVTSRVLHSRFVEDYRLDGFQYNFRELIERGHYFFVVKVYDYKTQQTEVFEKRFDMPGN